MSSEQIRLFQVDAFTDRLFSGNPAAVCPLERWLPAEIMQSIAAENNLSATAFVVPCSEGYELRWFTPMTEVDLCGHATLAAAFVIFNFLDGEKSTLCFRTKSGGLEVRREDDLIVLDLPSVPATPCAIPDGVVEALGTMPEQGLDANAHMLVFPSEAHIVELVPNFTKLAALPRTVIVTAPGDTVDFVSRYFAPSRGVPEDAVTGSAHCRLIPYWAKRLDKTKLKARQLSKRGGDLLCENRGERVRIAGRAVLYMQGTVCISSTRDWAPPR